MVRQPLPRGLKKAIERLESEPARAWRLEDLATAAGVAPRTFRSTSTASLAARRSRSCVSSVSTERGGSYFTPPCKRA